MLPEIGVSTAALYPDYLTEDALTIAARLEFPVVEVFMQTFAEHTPTYARQLERLRRDLGVRVHSLHLYALYFDLWSRYARQREESRERFLQVLEVAEILGAHALTWHGLRKKYAMEQEIGVFLESVVWAAEQAHRAGITLCIENVSWCYLHTPEHVRTLQNLGVPLGFTFDTFQAGESGVDPAALIQAMGSQIATVHISDYAPDGDSRHLPPGQGVLDWDGMLRSLAAVGYTGPLIVELAHVDDPLVLRQAGDFLRRRVPQAWSA